MDGPDLNSFSLLGFSPSIQAANEGQVSLQSIRTQVDAVMYCVDRNSDVRPHKVLEPWHDSNKLYAFIASIPLETVINLDPEDAGLEERSLHEPQEAGDAANLRVIGSGWVTEGEDPSPATRFMVLARHSESETWICAASQIGDFAAPYTAPSRFTSLCARAGIPLKEGTVLVPILQPKKLILEKGVVFIG